jgi:hypothetical protein
MATPVANAVTAVTAPSTTDSGSSAEPALTASATGSPSASTKRSKVALIELLQQAETIACLLAHNFGGDGSFEEPSEAPGLVGMVQCVASLLIAANELAIDLVLTDAAQKAILQARHLAEHLEAQSQEDLYNETRGFRLGDQFISMCYWTVEKLAKSAHEVLA